MKKYFMLPLFLLIFASCSAKVSNESDLNKIKNLDNTELIETTLGKPVKKSNKSEDLEKAITSSFDNDVDVNNQQALLDRTLIETSMNKNRNMTLYQYKYKKDDETFIRNIVTIKDNDEDFVLGSFNSK